ncbi:HD domain-containing protein [Clostridium sp. OS1-26]|uniref:HD domain-containing protein n=1 Tax=Clostridium sp. OS1-26 TaxID=3070681 RepID=UPI0027DEFC21|nr:HD domain-containing protein [Clostridium sp. OS1-26]WML35056.1 HD domain-containing protein [Clostridium sp. OS1-26]
MGLYKANEKEFKRIVLETAEFVREKLEGEGSGHDWWHVYRVWKSAVNISKYEKADLLTVELAALLHDIADWKFYNGDQTIGPKIAVEWLIKQKVDYERIEHIASIIKDISFKGAGVKGEMSTIEGMIVQDADRLDAIGAIGIGRAFAYGGHKGRELYNPDIKPVYHESFEQYKKSQGTTINHFYEKLLLLKDLMNTARAKELAVKRHEFMEEFLKQFYSEWNGKF